MSEAPENQGGAASVSPHDGPSVGDVIANKYRIDDVIGEGGMGRVYGGENLSTGKHVALKCLLRALDASAEALLRFKREARAAGRIDHPNVIQVYDVVDDGPYTFLVMERLRGEPLGALMKRDEQMSVEDSTAIAVEALRGLAAAHARGVVHRDIKPDNIYLCRSGSTGRVKLLDFGVSKLVTGDDLAATKTGAVVGTPYYMAPEQVRAFPDLDKRLDIYALGAVLYHMLTGRTPFPATSLPALAVQIAVEDITPISELRYDVPPALEEVVERAMARDRDERYQSVETFARALEQFAGGVRFRPEGPEWTGRMSSDSQPPGAGLGHSSTVRAVSTQGATMLRESDVAEPTTGRGRRWLIVAALVAALAAVGAAAWWMAVGPDEVQPLDDAEVTSEEAPPPGERASGAAEAVPVTETEEPEAEPAESTESTLAGETVAGEEEAVEDVAEPVGATKRRRVRRARMRRAVAMESPMDTEMGPAATQMHRAGMLSLDDF